MTIIHQLEYQMPVTAKTNIRAREKTYLSRVRMADGAPPLIQG